MKYGQGIRSNHDGWQQSVGQSVDCKSARRRQADSDRSSISLFETRSGDQQNGAWQCNSRDQEEAESHRLIGLAKKNDKYIDIKDTCRYGCLFSKVTGESHVYANEELALVFKVHNPFAKRVLKDLRPSDIIYEHIVHNILFPNARYTFVGITSEMDEVRIILSQVFCRANDCPSDQEISDYLQAMGLTPEDHYFFGNEFLSITDVSAASDNVLKDENGVLYFIDPIIRLKHPAPVVIDWLLSDQCTMWKAPQKDRKRSLLSRFLKFFHIKN